MSVLRYYCKDIDLRLQIEQMKIDFMLKESRKHYPKEYGGILIGRYSIDHNSAIITDVIFPTKYQNTKTSFVRGSESLEEKLTIEFNKDPSIFYLGEWHTHPNSGTNPSPIDKSTLVFLADHPEVKIENPIMLIIGFTKNSYECGFYVIQDKSIYRYDEDFNI